jgi:hypothetical protein
MTRLKAILGPGGTGKLLPNDELVLTPNGFIRNGDLNLDTKVISQNGKPTSILRIHEGFNLDIYRLTFHDGTSIKACKDHLWKVQTPKCRSNNTYKIVDTLTMVKDERLHNKREGYKYTIPLVSPVEYSKELKLDSSLMHPYLLGYLLGNGSLHKQVRVCCSKDDIEEIKSHFDRWLPRECRTLTASYSNNSDSAYFNISVEVKPHLDKLGLLGTYSDGKFIPAMYLQSSVEDRLDLLRGLMDSDGSIRLKRNGTRNICFYTKSPQLAQQVSDLVRGLGGISKLSTYQRPDFKGIEYNLNIRINLNVFYLSRKRSLYEVGKEGNRLNRKIVRIEYVGKEDGRCIEVKDPSHTYVARDFIVTHNSYQINQLIRANSTYGYRTATTGIAAVNMGSISGNPDPTTINRALRYFDAESLLRSLHKGTIYKALNYIARTYENLIIDEVSMINAPCLDIIVHSIKRYNEMYKRNFGLLVCGDPGQLPPVNGKPFFEAQCWSEFEVQFLTKVIRQDDKDFIEALGYMRKNQPKKAYDYFKDNITFVDKVQEAFRGTTFYSTNHEVDMYNKKCLARLRGESKIYTATLTGKMDPSWKNIPQRLELKRGAIIQLLYNDFDLGFANGDSAIVEEMWDNSVYIQLLRKHRQLFLKKQTLCNFGFTPKGFRKSKPDGTLELIHARLCYALTVHKAQGLTLDKVQINLKGTGTNFLAKQSGMLYTALSRVRTPEGLIVVGTVDDLMRCCYVNPNYQKWIK